MPTLVATTTHLLTAIEERLLPTERTLGIDARRRVSLGGLFDEDVTHLIAHRFEDGSVLLEPASVVSRLELQFHSDQSTVDAARGAARSTQATKVDLAERRGTRRRVA